MEFCCGGDGGGRYEDAAADYERGLEQVKEHIDAHLETVLARPFVSLWTLALNAPPVAVLKSQDVHNTPDSVHRLAVFVFSTVPVLIWLVQLTLLVAMVYSTAVGDETDGICPQSHSADVKITAGAVAAYYLAAVLQKSITVYSEAFRKFHGNYIISGGSLAGAGFDFWYNQAFDLAAYAGNLFYIFNRSTSVADLVFNSLAFEFIRTMDETYVATAIANPVVGRYLVVRAHLQDSKDRFYIGGLYDIGTYFFALGPILPAIAACVYMPLCI